jgi:hypothetical protein
MAGVDYFCDKTRKIYCTLFLFAHRMRTPNATLAGVKGRALGSTVVRNAVHGSCLIFIRNENGYSKEHHQETRSEEGGGKEARS